MSPDTMDPPTAPPMTYCLIGRNPRHMDPKKRIYGQIICCPFHLFSSSTFEVLIRFTASKFIRLTRYTLGRPFLKCVGSIWALPTWVLKTQIEKKDPKNPF